MFDRVIGLISQERLRQDAKWGEQHHPLAVWLQILGEEIGELAQAANDRYFDGAPMDDVQTEAVQAAAVLVAILEAILKNDKTL